jgi:hypothetical protein
MPYRIILLTRNGAPLEERQLDFEHDDAAIDHLGDLAHPHEIDLWHGDRHVARRPFESVFS